MGGLYFSTSPLECFIWMSLYGVFHGVYVSLRSLVLQDIFGRNKLNSIYSFNNFVIGLGMLIMPVILGVIGDTYNLNYSLLFLAIIFFIGASFLGGVALAKWRNVSIA